MHVSLASILERVSQNKPLQEQPSHFNLFILTCVDPSIRLSFGKTKYFIFFIDDYSRKSWVYFLKQKSEAFVAFKNFKALVEKNGYEIKS